MLTLDNTLSLGKWLSPIVFLAAVIVHSPETFAGGSQISGTGTRSIVSLVGDGATKTCEIVPAIYRADCLAQSLNRTSKKIRNKAYQPVQSNLQSTANSINEIVEANFDADAPLAKAGNKTYRPVKKELLEQVHKQITKVIVESATTLIRSAGNSVTKKIHFQRIAKAIDSTKNLLRSA